VRAATLLASLGLALPLLSGCVSQAPTWEGLGRSTLEGLERADGRFDPFLVPYVIEAAARIGLEPAEWPARHPVADDLAVPAVPYLATLRPSYALALANPGDAAVTSQVRAAALAGFAGKQFGDANLTLDDAFAILALAAVGNGAAPQVAAAADFLQAAANATGGWSYLRRGAPDVDSTAWCSPPSPPPAAPPARGSPSRSWRARPTRTAAPARRPASPPTATPRCGPSAPAWRWARRSPRRPGPTWRLCAQVQAGPPPWRGAERLLLGRGRQPLRGRRHRRARRPLGLFV